MPNTFDGVGAWLPDASSLRLNVNHEETDATISEVNLSLSSFQTAVSNMISGGTTGGVSFVQSAQQAYDRWSNNAGSSWTNTVDVSNTSFYRFCSGQSYDPNTFGEGRGFVDHIYITGEEGSTNRLFAIDMANRDLYQLSGVAGSATGGIGGMPFDSWENAALLDTGETNHVALLLSPDGGTQRMQLYIGEKNKNQAGSDSTDFLARNGLAYGSYYYLNDSLPASGTSTDGFFDTTTAGALTSTKLEDIDTSPSDPTRAVLGDQDSGLFTFDFALDFGDGNFSASTSGFSITKIQNHVNDVDGSFGDADNVDWTDATTLAGVTYNEGLIFVNEDSGTNNGEIWMMEPTGGGLTLIGDTVGIGSATESSGILDISQLVGYRPGSILVTTNQGTIGSLTALINPAATVVVEPPGDFDNDGDYDCDDVNGLVAEIAAGSNSADFDLTGDALVNQEDLTAWLAAAGSVNLLSGGAYLPGDANLDGTVDGQDFIAWNANKFTSTAAWCSGDFNADGVVDGQDFIAWNANKFTSADGVSAIPEPGMCALGFIAMVLAIVQRLRRNGIFSST